LKNLKFHPREKKIFKSIGVLPLLLSRPEIPSQKITKKSASKVQEKRNKIVTRLANTALKKNTKKKIPMLHRGIKLTKIR